VGAAGLFTVSLVLAISVGLAIEFVFGGLLVLLQLPHWAVSQVRGAITTLLSGAIVPLALLPQGVGAAFAWLPFASMASAPLQIYTGTGESIRLLALQAGWSIVLWPLAHWLWRVSRERMVAYGG
jgi:ABC-2 type transport system permease protein